LEVVLETQRITQNLDPHQPSVSDQHLVQGMTLANRYLIQGVIGVGGMGAVYRARDLHFPKVEKKVAVKEMVIQARDQAMQKTIIANFEREANILATLSHPSIPRIYDYFTQEERSYLILEFVEGKDLDLILNEAGDFFPENQVISWAIELCDVLHYLHNHKPDPIIFRDMKPSNIMVNPNGHIVLVDFGIAKPFDSSPRGTMIGTEGYSPPEQYRGEASPLADIYALGATLHHVLTQHDPRLEAPFSFADRPIQKFNPSVSTELERVIYTALEYAPEHRFQSAKQMKNALLAAAKTTGALKDISVHPSPEESENLRQVWNFECEDEVRGPLTCVAGMVLAGSYDNNCYALDAETGRFLWKYAAEGAIASKPVYYEGRVYFGSEDRRVHAVNGTTGEVSWTYYTEEPVWSSPCLSDNHVFIGSDDGYLHAVHAQTGRGVWRVDASAPIRSTPLVHNETILFGTEAGELLCINFGGSVIWRFGCKRAVTSSPVVYNGWVIFGSQDATLYALDVKTGWVIWRFRLGKASISSPAVAENFIYTGATDGHIVCIEGRSAKELWRFKTEHQVTGSPVIQDDSLYCGSVDGNLYCLDTRSGRLRWKFRTEGPITGTPAVNKGVVYIGSIDHRIYALSA
jgi:eukaryotic-like serine/threonine-protein kinase